MIDVPIGILVINNIMHNQGELYCININPGIFIIFKNEKPKGLANKDLSSTFK